MGGRKKSSKKVVKKKKPGLRSVFKCVQCNNEDAVECHIDKGKGIGSLNCRLCGANFADRVNYLTKPIDIYCSWIDACEEANGVAETEDDLRRQLAEMAAGGGAA